ncbi:MAG: hypothetical protein IJQ10_00165 [Clostridia bacterium]|nr:hypothetical protein [Clostridia bacterium]
MEVIQIVKLKDIFISKITDEIKKMSDNDFLNYFINDMNLFSTNEILTFESLDNTKVKLTYLNGVNSLIHFLNSLEIKESEKDYIKLNLKCIKNLLESIINYE